MLSDLLALTTAEKKLRVVHDLRAVANVPGQHLAMAERSQLMTHSPNEKAKSRLTTVRRKSSPSATGKRAMMPTGGSLKDPVRALLHVLGQGRRLSDLEVDQYRSASRAGGERNNPRSQLSRSAEHVCLLATTTTTEVSGLPTRRAGGNAGGGRTARALIRDHGG